MNDNYKVFGLSEDCSDEELDAKYGELKAKYSEERFLEGEAGNEAAKKLTEIETAYADIKAARAEKTERTEEKTELYAAIEKDLSEGKLNDAQQKLDSFNERGAEWHYLQAAVFYKKNWSNESKKQLEIAMQVDPANEKYKNAYEKLVKKIDADSDKRFSSYTTGDDRRGYETEGGRQMGGNYCLEWCCEMAICNMLLNCCCNCR
ncbi:MAG TPA: hypothetical protein DDW54_04150 [Clostridiales bacterium]|nr:hypothetical protein [Clostridiales bacterium]